MQPKHFLCIPVSSEVTIKCLSAFSEYWISAKRDIHLLLRVPVRTGKNLRTTTGREKAACMLFHMHSCPSSRIREGGGHMTPPYIVIIHKLIVIVMKSCLPMADQD